MEAMSIFLDNKYTRWYYQLCQRGQSRVTDQYTESHHIIPESFFKNRSRSGPAGWLDGDPDDPRNLVRLTGREHALCHWLLTKMTNGVAHIKMSQAFEMMSVDSRSQDRSVSRMITRAYECNRIEVAKLRGERMRENNVARLPGVGDKIAVRKSGVKRGEFSQEWIDNMSTAKQGEKNSMWGKRHKDSTRDLQRKKAELMMWVTDGVTSKRIHKSDAQSYLGAGWTQGRHNVKRGPRGPYKKKFQQ